MDETFVHILSKMAMINNAALEAKRKESAQLAEAMQEFLHNGGKVKIAPKGHYSPQHKKARAVLGPETQGRAGLWGGKRWIYGN